MQDKKYKAFQAALIPNIPAETVIGVRTPQLRRLAREIDPQSSFMRSLPISPGLYQKAVPLFTAAYPAALLTLVNIAYAIFITATGRASANIADMLTLGGIAQLLFSVPICLTLCGCRPAFFAAYFLVFSCFGILVGYVDSFGVGVGAGLLIFAGALSVSFAANMVIGKAYYKKSNLQATAINNSSYFHK